MTLDAKLVDRVQGRERDALTEYNRTASLTADTLETHLYWARWCFEQQLSEQAKLHWRQVLELDPDHEDARRVLGYVKDMRDPTGWGLEQDKRANRGYVLHQGHWKTQQQIEVENLLENQKREGTDWKKTIRDLCRRLPNEKAADALLAIRDPAAIDSLGEVLRSEDNPQRRAMLIRSLVRIPDARALQIVAAWSVGRDERSHEVRQICIEELQNRMSEHPALRRTVVDTYRSVLRPTLDPNIINWIAKTLGDIGAYEAVPELIDVLVVDKTETYKTGQQGFGQGGLEWGERTITNKVRVPNESVLKALRQLTGENFEFNQAAWREWYRKPHRSPVINLRRN
jgi:tetratricopeptide (TPR) repeat protein